MHSKLVNHTKPILKVLCVKSDSILKIKDEKQIIKPEYMKLQCWKAQRQPKKGNVKILQVVLKSKFICFRANHLICQGKKEMMETFIVESEERAVDKGIKETVSSQVPFIVLASCSLVWKTKTAN